MSTVEPEPDELAAADALRRAGARFAFVHGSRATGRARPDSDLDVAAWWGTDACPAPWEVVDDAPLELAGRVAVDGRLLFEVDPASRVDWQARTRIIYFDEQWRQDWIERTFLEAHARG